MPSIRAFAKEIAMNRYMIATILLSTSALAGPYDQVYGLITVDTSRSADPNLIPVIVNRVDDETVPMRQPAVVAPGVRKVTIDVPPRKGFSQATQQTFDLDVKPCTRYYVAARLDSPTTQSWRPVVRGSEVIGECQRKFKVAGLG
jgi:hypothetical protein